MIITRALLLDQRARAQARHDELLAHYNAQVGVLKTLDLLLSLEGQSEELAPPPAKGPETALQGS